MVRRTYHPRRKETWELLRCLYLVHILEDPTMAYTMEEFVREARQRFLQELTPEEQRAVLDRLPPEEVFKHFTLEERLRGLKPEERLRGLGLEERLRGLKPEERLHGLEPEELRQLEEYLRTLH
jgi:hypothetical protein